MHIITLNKKITVVQTQFRFKPKTYMKLRTKNVIFFLDKYALSVRKSTSHDLTQLERLNQFTFKIGSHKAKRKKRLRGRSIPMAPNLGL